jgi:hypothetical protein
MSLNETQDAMQEAIRNKRAAIMVDLHEAEAIVEGHQARLRALKRLCLHPNAKDVTHMGEPCWHCPDCGNCP